MTSQTTHLNGNYAQAKIFTNLVDDLTLEQVQQMVDHPITAHAQVRIMPDCHIGKGSTIGTTILLSENRDQWKISPNVVGVDIGCGMLSYQLADEIVDLARLDQMIRRHIPSGFSVHPKSYSYDTMDLIRQELGHLTIKLSNQSHQRIIQSIGTLGGGNHFIELTRDESNHYWLTVHTGSRNLGVQVADTHQKIAQKLRNTKSHLAYLEDDPLEDYLNDATIAQNYAAINRRAILDRLVDLMDLSVIDSFDSIHSFVDLKTGIIRKGATSAHLNQRLLIPLNMRDGSVIARGKGNDDWNQSAPHGAGRVLSRSQARRELSLKDFQSTMAGIYTTSVSSRTLDEAPKAYKPADQILDRIDGTVEITHHLKPVYNFKA